jgi:hypothetical protein
MQRYQSHTKMIEVSVFAVIDRVTHAQYQGEVTVKEPGLYKLRWDNSYSKLRKKVLHFSTAVFDQEASSAAAEDEGENLISLDTLDPYELLKAIEGATEGTISVDGMP